MFEKETFERRKWGIRVNVEKQTGVLLKKKRKISLLKKTKSWKYLVLFMKVPETSWMILEICNNLFSSYWWARVKIFRPGLGQIFDSRLLSWVGNLWFAFGKFSLNIPVFLIFFPSGQKVKKQPGQRWVGLIFTAGSKVCSGWVRAHL